MNFKSILAVVVVALSFVVVGCTDNSQYLPKNKTKTVDRSDRVVEFFEGDDEFLDIDLYKKPKKTYYQKERRFQQKPKKKSYFRVKKKRKWRY